MRRSIKICRMNQKNEWILCCWRALQMSGEYLSFSHINLYTNTNQGRIDMAAAPGPTGTGGRKGAWTFEVKKREKWTPGGGEKGTERGDSIYLCLYLSSVYHTHVPTVYSSILFIYLPIICPSIIPIIYVSIIYHHVYLSVYVVVSHSVMFDSLWPYGL